jgi:chemotaxis protein CheX
MSAAPKLSESPLTDKAFIQSFINSAIKTMEVLAQTPSEVTRARIEKKYSPESIVAGFIGVNCGNHQSHLTLSFSDQAIFSALKNMLGESYNEISDPVCDAVGELTNQVYGSAKTELNKLGYHFEMAIPTSVVGRDKIAAIHPGPTLVIPFKVKADQSPFFIEVTLIN